jgi:glucose-1-phosphate cytidylyltransferase
MKVVILAGGYGTRLSEETEVTPKPMLRIGGLPVLWHIMKLYSYHGFMEFVICLGYKGYVIKEYFANYFLHMSDVTFDLTENDMIVHHQKVEPWKITLVDTGSDTMTGGRLARVRSYLTDDTFCLTYGDGVGDIDLSRLVEFHRQSGTKATVTAVRPPSRFGTLEIQRDRAIAFREKPQTEEGWISGGFFVLESSVLDLVRGDDVVWEREPLESLAREGELSVYRHQGFWQPMDTLREKRLLEQMWREDVAPWKVWT